MDYYNFYKGQCFDAYEFFGAHVTDQNTWFRTYAPAANRVAVIGEFNDWTETPMQRAYDGSTWECCIPAAQPGQMYKYRIYDQNGRAIDHCDPYGFGMELRPKSASIIRELRAFEFDDWDWMLSRTDRRNEPLNIYEVHAGSWHKNPSRNTVTITSSSCRWRSTPRTIPGATRTPASSRRPPGTARWTS